MEVRLRMPIAVGDIILAMRCGVVLYIRVKIAIACIGKRVGDGDEENQVFPPKYQMCDEASFLGRTYQQQMYRAWMD